MPSVATSRLEGLETSVAVKAPCRVATAANITLSGLQTIDGFALAARDRVLVKNQTSAVDNGVWVAGTGAWTRALDFDGTRDAVGGTRVFVTSGGAAGNSEWKVLGDGPIDIGTDSITFVRITPGGNIPDGAITPLAYGAVGDGVTDDLTACNLAADAARAAGKVLYFPAGYHFKVSDKIDRTGVHVIGDGEASVITGAAGKDVLYWKRPDEGGYSAPFFHVTKGLRINLDCTSDVSSSYNRIGGGGHRIGNCAVVFPDDNKAAATTWLYPRFEDLHIRNLTGGSLGNRTAAFFFGHPFNGLYMKDVYGHYPSYGLIQGIPGARPVSADAGADTITWTAHGLSNNQKVAFLASEQDGTLPSPLSVRTAYFVVNATTDTFQVSLTSGGAAINLTTAGSGSFYCARAGTTLGIEFAPDEWVFEGSIILNTYRCGLSLVNNGIMTAQSVVLHPERISAEFLGYPSNARANGSGLDIRFLYTEGPLDASFGTEAWRCEWDRTRIFGTTIQPTNTGGTVTGTLAGSEGEYQFQDINQYAQLNVTGHRNIIRAGSQTDERAIVTDKGTSNKISYFKRTSGGPFSAGVPEILADRSLFDRGGFDPAWLQTNPSSKYRGAKTLFVPGTATGPFGIGSTSYSYHYDDDTIEVPGYLKMLTAMTASVANLYSWDGRNATESNITVGTHIPAARGTLYIKAKADTACNCVLSVNLATVPLTTTMALTTSWQTFSVRYDASGVAPGTNLSAQLQAPSVSAERHVAWFCFVPDTERVRSHQLALSGVTFSALTNGGSTTIGANVHRLQNTTTGTIATHTITLPAAPQDGDIVEIGTDGEITGLTLSPNAGQTVTGAPTTLLADTSCSFFYRASTAIWYRRQ